LAAPPPCPARGGAARFPPTWKPHERICQDRRAEHARNQPAGTVLGSPRVSRPHLARASLLLRARRLHLGVAERAVWPIAIASDPPGNARGSRPRYGAALPPAALARHLLRDDHLRPPAPSNAGDRDDRHSGWHGGPLRPHAAPGPHHRALP